MIDQHFMKNGSPTLKWYKSHNLSVRKPKKLFNVRKRRVINYYTDLAGVLTSLYNTETDFRLENDVKNKQFIFTIIGGTDTWSRSKLDDFSENLVIISETADSRLSRLSALPKFDWIPENRFKGKTITDVTNKFCNSYLKNYNDDYLASWLRGYSKFAAGWKVEYTHKSKRRFSIAKILEDLHEKKIAFRIESLWDTGFTGIVVSKEVTPSRVQVDEYNSLERFGDDNLFEVAENDWLKRFYASDIEELVRKMSVYVKNMTG